MVGDTSRTFFCNTHRTPPVHGGVVKLPSHAKYPEFESHRVPGSIFIFVMPWSAASLR